MNSPDNPITTLNVAEEEESSPAPTSQPQAERHEYNIPESCNINYNGLQVVMTSIYIPADKLAAHCFLMFKELLDRVKPVNGDTPHKQQVGVG